MLPLAMYFSFLKNACVYDGILYYCNYMQKEIENSFRFFIISFSKVREYEFLNK